MPISRVAVKDEWGDRDTVLLGVLSEGDYAKIHIKGPEGLSWGQRNDEFVKAIEAKYGKERFFMAFRAHGASNAAPQAAPNSA